jgi:dipeptidyl aminopeptidase/acylaminoacyl peptidase
MRPKLFTPRNAILFLCAVTILFGLIRWVQEGMRLPGQGVPSTAGKIVYVATANGHPDLWMMDKDGSNAVALMNDEAEDRQPSFSPNGQEITFTSAKRNGANPQVYVMDAAPNRKPIYLSSSKTAKAAPFYVEQRKIGFLDTGKLIVSDTISAETEALLPHHDLKNILNDFFSVGGLEKVVALDDHVFLAVCNLEVGQAVLYYQYEHDDLNKVALAILGIAEKIRIEKNPAGGFAIVFNSGGLLAQPAPIITPELLQAYNSGMKPSWPNVGPQEGTHMLVVVDEGGNAKAGLPLPFAADSLSVTPDGKSFVLGVQSDEANNGLYVITPETQKADKIAELPATDVAVSPDGSTVAFVANNDIYVVPITGGEPKNLTNGKGASSAPSWSAAEAKK